MKKFAGHKTLDVIKQQCQEAGIEFDDRLHKTGSDYVVVRTIKGDKDSGIVLYSSFNGNFFGSTPDGVDFDSASTEHENEPWFQALLSFFYIEK